jgi:hypothetical protein
MLSILKGVYSVTTQRTQVKHSEAENQLVPTEVSRPFIVTLEPKFFPSFIKNVAAHLQSSERKWFVIKLEGLYVWVPALILCASFSSFSRQYHWNLTKE